jgi:uncharacterized protein (TIGR03118 family)
MKMNRFGFGSYVAVLSVCGLQFLSMTFLCGSVRAQSASPTPTPAVPGNFDWTNLQSDIAGVADRTDTNLVNPWGLTINPVNPAKNAFWVSDNNSGVSTLYTLDGAPVPLVVTIPPTSADTGTPKIAAPTGIVFNPSKTAFMLPDGQPAAFIFDGEDGSITAWNGGLNPITQAVIKVDNSSPDPTKSSVYKGLALATRATGGLTLYATNFHNGTVDVYDDTFKKATISGTFTDTMPKPALPPGAVGWAPFGIANIDGLLFVTFAAQNSVKHDDVGAPGAGFVDVFDTEGNFVQRLVTGGELNSPWGLAEVPGTFGSLNPETLLVGNFGDGHINAYDIKTKKFLGQLVHRKGEPLQFDGLWSLLFVQNRLYFTAGIVGEAHGLFGFIVPAAKEETGGF